MVLETVGLHLQSVLTGVLDNTTKKGITVKIRTPELRVGF
jgi:hypothetical protein